MRKQRDSKIFYILTKKPGLEAKFTDTKIHTVQGTASAGDHHL